jgi:hypothetical protein
MPKQTEKQKHRRLFYLQEALDRMAMLVFTADCWLSPAACDALADELEPLVRGMAAKIEMRVPDLVLPYTLEDDSGIDEVVEIEMRDLKESLARLG